MSKESVGRGLITQEIGDNVENCGRDEVYSLVAQLISNRTVF